MLLQVAPIKRGELLCSFEDDGDLLMNTVASLINMANDYELSTGEYCRAVLWAPGGIPGPFKCFNFLNKRYFDN